MCRLVWAVCYIGVGSVLDWCGGQLNRQLQLINQNSKAELEQLEEEFTSRGEQAKAQLEHQQAEVDRVAHELQLEIEAVQEQHRETEQEAQQQAQEHLVTVQKMKVCAQAKLLVVL